MPTWYSTGTVSVTNGSVNVAGTGSSWSGNTEAGEAFRGPDGQLYEIASVVSDTALTLAEPYLGATLSDQDYAIVPVRGVLKAARDALAAAVAQMTAYGNTALAGRFGDGTAAAPGIGFEADPDTGLHRPGDNQIAMAAGGIDRLLLSTTALQTTVPITGTAVQADPMDATTGKLMPVGAFGLGGTVTAYDSADDYDALPSVNHMIGHNTGSNYPANAPAEFFTSGAVGFELGTNENRRAQMLIRTQSSDGNNGPRVAFRGKDTTWGDWVEMLSSKMVQTDVRDSVAGKLLAVGAFGIGSLAAHETSDFDAIDETGVFSNRSNEAVTGIPGGQGSHWVALNGRASSDRGMQLAGRASGLGNQRLQFRTEVTGTWKDWVGIVTTESVVGPVAQSGGVLDTNSGIIERGSNANGEYTKFADGTLICANHQFSTTSGAMATWTFPHIFASSDVSVVGTSTHGPAARTLSISGRTASHCDINTFNETGSDTVAPAVQLLAFGRWF